MSLGRDKISSRIFFQTQIPDHEVKVLGLLNTFFGRVVTLAFDLSRGDLRKTIFSKNLYRFVITLDYEQKQFGLRAWNFFFVHLAKISRISWKQLAGSSKLNSSHSRDRYEEKNCFLSSGFFLIDFVHPAEPSAWLLKLYSTCPDKINGKNNFYEKDMLFYHPSWILGKSFPIWQDKKTGGFAKTEFFLPWGKSWWKFL